jgi:hypothetical protein
MQSRCVRLVSLVLLAIAATACTREDPDCLAAGQALSDPAYRQQLRTAVQRQFDAGDLGEVHKLVRPDMPAGLPGKYAVKVAPEFGTLSARPLYQRTIFDQRGHLLAVFVGWAPGKGVAVDVPDADGGLPEGVLTPATDYGDGVVLACSAGADD